MALVDLNITEPYAAFTILRQSQLNTAMTSIETYVNTNVKLNFQQIGLDVFGNTYVFNNDGLQTVVTPLINSAAILSENETVTGNWTYSGTVQFNNTVNFAGIANSSVQPRTRAFLSVANQTINDNLATMVAFNGESYDVGTMHDIAVNNTRITVPTSGSGTYLIDAQIRFVASAVGRREIAIFKNGLEIARSVDVAAIAARDSYLQCTIQDSGTVGDFYEVNVYQNSGGGLDLVFGANNTWFAAMKVW